MTREKVVAVLAILGVTTVTNMGQFALQSYDKKRIAEEYQAQIDEANNTLSQLGNLVTCYTIEAKDDIESGDPAMADDLTELLLPESSVTEQYITDPQEVVGKYYKIAVHPGTPLTQDMFMEEQVDDTLRDVDISIDTWPTGLKVGDYIDVRLTYPKGEDYVVLSHKRIYDINSSSLKVHLSEREILFFGAANIDKFVNASFGATITATKYIDPGLQTPALVYYQVPDNIMEVISNDPNILDKIIDSSVPRDMIDAQMQNISDQLGAALGAGRTQYQSRLDQARDYYTQQGKDATSKGTDSDTEEIPDDGSSDNTDSSDSGSSEKIADDTDENTDTGDTTSEEEN